MEMARWLRGDPAADRPSPLSFLVSSDFLAATYADLRATNPGFPLLVREGDACAASARARYDFGAESATPLDGLDAAGVEAALASLVKKGESMPRSAESK
jgi:hypothetical protein